MSGVGIVLLAAVAIYVWTRPEEVAYLRRLSIPVLLLTLLSQFLVQLLLNDALLSPLQAYMAQLGFWEFFIVRTGGVLAGSLVPVAGGLAVRLTYLRRRGLTYLDFTWATILSNVLALVASAALAVLATGILWMVAGRPPALILWLSLGVLALSVAAQAVFQSLPRLSRHAVLTRWPWVAGIRDRKADRKTTMRVFVASLARHGLNFVTFGLLYASVSGLPRDFMTGGLVYTLTSPLRIVNITPGNLGINEWVIAIVGHGVAFDVTTGLMVALVFRGVAFVAQTLGVLVAWAWLASHSR